MQIELRLKKISSLLVSVICHRQLCGGLENSHVVEADRTDYRRTLSLRRAPGTRFLLLHLDRDPRRRRDCDVSTSARRSPIIAPYVSETLSDM